MNAKTRTDFVKVNSIETTGNDKCLIVDCADFDVYSALPIVVEFRGEIYCLTGWNSDKAIACYKTNCAVALKVR